MGWGWRRIGRGGRTVGGDGEVDYVVDAGEVKIVLDLLDCSDGFVRGEEEQLTQSWTAGACPGPGWARRPWRKKLGIVEMALQVSSSALYSCWETLKSLLGWESCVLAKMLGVDDNDWKRFRTRNKQRTTSLDGRAMSPCRDQPSSDPIHGLCGTRLWNLGRGDGMQQGMSGLGFWAPKRARPHLSIPYSIHPNAGHHAATCSIEGGCRL